MGLESASFISDLDTSNPPGTDKKKQGDDHLRLIKTVLKACFPTASKAWYNPTASASQTANFSVVAADMNKTWLVDTSSNTVTATLPTLASGDAGWECSFIKTNTGTNPMFIAPPSGTIQSGEVAGLAKTRRCIPGHRTRVTWTGAAWIAERVAKLPVGSIITFHVDSLPVGYEYANGQTLSSASTNYPDLFAITGTGVLADFCGRVAAGQDDMGGISSVNRLTGLTNGVNGDTFGAAGGLESMTIVTANLPAYTPLGTINTPTITTKTRTRNDTLGAGATPFATTAASATGADVTDSSTSQALTFTGTAQGGVSTATNNVQPTIITNRLVVVE